MFYRNLAKYPVDHIYLKGFLNALLACFFRIKHEFILIFLALTQQKYFHGLYALQQLFNR